MNIYSQKQKWKIVLIVIAMIIVGINVWYSNFMVRDIKQAERLKLERWSETIKQRAQLVNYAHKLYQDLKEEENKKMEIFADALQRMLGNNEYEDYTFISKIIKQNTTIPVIILYSDSSIHTTRNLNLGFEPDLKNPEHQKLIRELVRTKYTKYEPFIMYLDLAPNINKNTEKLILYYNDSRIFTELQNNLGSLIASFEEDIRNNDLLAPVIYTDQNRRDVITFGNIDSSLIDTPEKIKERIAFMISENEPIEVDLGNGSVNFIFYENSKIITQLRYYPLIQLAIIGAFIMVTYFLFSSFRRAEQNQVWAGLSKETAHQLGTPLSSLMAWVEHLEAQGIDPEIIKELNKDLLRLNVITDRFSKIGSQPELNSALIIEELKEAVQYLRTRISKRIEFDLIIEARENIEVQINKPLFSWVIENLVKNAVDAMRGEGKLMLTVSENETQVFIDVSDTGHGMSLAYQKLIFQPGFTTKKRGWGLGLSLAKRIINDYHKGKIFVKYSEPGKGCTFRIALEKSGIVIDSSTENIG
jgi:two-component system, sporulation sensor kinase D